MANEFSIQPAGDFSGPLSGLGDTLAGVIKQRKMQAAQQEIGDAMQKGDTDTLMKLSVKYPEFRQQLEAKVTQQTGLEAKERKDLLVQSLSAPDDASAEQFLVNHVHDVMEKGGDVTPSLASLKLLHEDPAKWRKSQEMGLILTDPAAAKALREATQEKADPAEVETMKFRAEQAGLVKGTPEYKEFFKNNGKPQEAQSPLGKLADDLKNKRITQEEYDAEKNHLTALSAAQTAAANAAAQTEKSAGLTGDEFLKTLPESMAGTVKAIAEGRSTYSSLGVRGPAREALVNAVNQYAPGYDEADAISRYKAMDAFVSGKNGNTTRFLNTAIDHLGTLQKTADALGNGDAQALNYARNKVSAWSGGAPPTDFNATKKIVADEIVKAIVGTGGGVADREEAAASISGVNSPAQLAGVINRYKDLLAGQLHGLKTQYEAGTKRNDFSERFLTEEARAQLDNREKIGAPPTITSQKQYDALPSGAEFMEDGKRYKKP